MDHDDPVILERAHRGRLLLPELAFRRVRWVDVHVSYAIDYLILWFKNTLTAKHSSFDFSERKYACFFHTLRIFLWSTYWLQMNSWSKEKFEERTKLALKVKIVLYQLLTKAKIKYSCLYKFFQFLIWHGFSVTNILDQYLKEMIIIPQF